MEPTTENRAKSPISDEEIEMMLHAHAQSQPHPLIADDGFTARVMSALPPPAPSAVQQPKLLSSRLRNLLITAPSAAATLAVMTSNRGESFLVDATMDIATSTLTPSVVGLGMLLVVSIAGAATMLARGR